MKTWFCLMVALALIASPASAQTEGFQDPLLDLLIGEWVLEGTIGGVEATHDIVSDWVLRHEYVRFHEVSRERDSTGALAYEAIVFIGWDAPSERYVCLWLDSTGGEGLRPDGLGYGVRTGDSIPFVFRLPNGDPFHNTFVYDRVTDTWQWRLDGEANGTRQLFARVTLSRK